ncbi:ABC transporter ATP-binding protein [Celerinatantimonas yamalensis]|uniref:Sn-glycerol-3-phosphate ABC transporter ATP-binding protein UgpC n=1 Tax=Celerinatantimonas yamalensis TaxID=559956 RepID=A0ABW9G2S9_9GAMM
MAAVTLRQIEKTYPNGFQAVHGIDLHIDDGEFMVLVGPSGCAKSTTLRMIAGLEAISAGDLLIGEQRVNDLAPKNRGIAMVFQNYALYPHMNAYQNMAFGLKQLRLAKSEICSRIEQAAKNLDIAHLLDKKPSEMSGGQRQRVALGRAIVRKPDVFLFDEPLSNLDAKLRVSTRIGIAKLHQELKEVGQQSTMIYVTHDQVEAMTLGDRICVMNDGQIMQVDTPMHLYHHPANKFVAGFIGSPAMNLAPAQLEYIDQQWVIQLGEYQWVLPASVTQRLQIRQSKSVWLGIRPEHIRPVKSNERTESQVQIHVDVVEAMGNEQYVYFKWQAESWISRVSLDELELIEKGSTQWLTFDLNKLHLFDKDTEQSLLDAS